MTGPDKSLRKDLQKGAFDSLKLWAWLLFVAMIGAIWIGKRSTEIPSENPNANSKTNPKYGVNKTAPNQRKLAGTENQNSEGQPNNISSDKKNLNGSTGSRAAQQAELAEFLKEKDPDSDWIIETSPNGLVSSMMGGIIPTVGTDKLAGLEFAREIGAILGVDSKDIVIAVSDDKETPASKTFYYDQIYNGVKVYGGYISVFSRNSDGAVYLVNSGVKDLGRVDLSDRITEEKVRASLLNHYADRDPKIEKIKPEKVIFMVEPGRSELAWVGFVITKLPDLQHLEVLISANDGRILHDVNLLRH